MQVRKIKVKTTHINNFLSIFISVYMYISACGHENGGEGGHREKNVKYDLELTLLLEKV